LNFGFHILNGVRGFNLQGDGLACQGFDKDLHTTSEPQNQVKGGFLLNIVVWKGSAILKLLSSKDQPLLVWRNSLFILNFGFHILNGIRGLNLQGDSLACQSFDKDLHTSSEPQNQVKGWFLLNIVVWQGSAILKLLSGKDQPLLVWRNSLFVLNFGFHILNGVRGLNLQGDGLACQGFDKDLHTSSEPQN